MVRMTGLFLFIAAAAVAQVRENITVNLIEVPVTVVDGMIQVDDTAELGAA